VSEQGQCGLSQAKVLAALRNYQEAAAITIQADEDGLRIGGLLMPVTSYHPQALAPNAFHIFLATDSGVVSSMFARPIEQVAAA
jgi:hypothetical protein